jgi:hypothetical protein
MEHQCEEHGKVCGELGSIGANINSLTAAILTLNNKIDVMSSPIYHRIDKIEDKVTAHENDSLKYREKIVQTEVVLREYIKHCDEREARAMWRIGIVVTLINVSVTVVVRLMG